MARRRNNPYAGADRRTQQAKAKGYPARSVFKLEEIDRRCRVFRQGQHVLDLGAAPGSWTLYAAQHVGPRGRLVAVDLKPIKQQFPPSVTTLRGDALASEVGSEVRRVLLAGGPYDVVMSDMAPNTSGNTFTDQVRSFELCMGALRVARELGKPGSHFVAKIFMSGEFPAAKQAVTAAFLRCRVVRPEGTRDRSTEIFLVGQGLKSEARLPGSLGDEPQQGQ